MAHYVDTSALVKLVVAEAESAPLLAWLTVRGRKVVACDLARTELVRAVRRAAPERAAAAREVLESVTLLTVTTDVFEAAGRLDPPLLRTLDAIHLASALILGDELEGVVTYDGRLGEAAAALGIPVLAPA